MPKKRHNAIFANPTNTVHPTLLSSGPRHHSNNHPRPSQASSSTAESPSVNDLINHLRRTQVSSSSEDGVSSPHRHIAPRSVHPSLRNLLELPETPPPRPRPDASRNGVGGRRLRRTAGPPPPESWLLGNTDPDLEDGQDKVFTGADTERVIYRLERLPGIAFPSKSTLLRMLLKSMALHWAWHTQYDGQFLALLPTQIKVLLLSFLVVYARDQPSRGVTQVLGLLFPKIPIDGEEGDSNQDTDPKVRRLDLGNAIGRWISLKQLTRDLTASQSGTSMQRMSKDVVPSSWEDDQDEADDSASGSTAFISKPLSQGLRFENLRFLSLAHPNPRAVNWNTLIDLLSRLSTLTHLSLAHWPIPTVTPNAINARVTNPVHRSLTFSYGGTDTYSALENNWAEVAGVLRRLSRATYCLKWLDLEGCGNWIPALNWDGVDPDGNAYASGSAGPEWNGCWRDIEWIRLGPGWLPHIDDGELTLLGREREAQQSSSSATFNVVLSESLASSMHAPSSSPDLPWDVEIERIKYRRSKELERYREVVRSAKAVQRRVLQIRREGRGKWAQFSFGLEELDEEILRKLLGADYLDFFP